MRPTKYSAEVLAPIVASSSSVADVLRRLGLKMTGGNHRMVSMRIRYAQLDTSHFLWKRGVVRFELLPKDKLETLVRESLSIAQVLEALGYPTNGRPFHDMKRALEKLGIETSHFKGQGWSRGETKRTNVSVASGVRKRMFTDEEVFVENSPLAKGASLVERLLARGCPYRCAWCGIAEWRGRRLVLHLDHINGINNDNRFENLRLLCPNCHSQTDTYGNRAREEAACYMLRARERGATWYPR